MPGHGPPWDPHGVGALPLWMYADPEQLAADIRSAELRGRMPPAGPVTVNPLMMQQFQHIRDQRSLPPAPVTPGPRRPLRRTSTISNPVLDPISPEEILPWKVAQVPGAFQPGAWTGQLLRDIEALIPQAGSSEDQNVYRTLNIGGLLAGSAPFLGQAPGSAAMFFGPKGMKRLVASGKESPDTLKNLKYARGTYENSPVESQLDNRFLQELWDEFHWNPLGHGGWVTERLGEIGKMPRHPEGLDVPFLARGSDFLRDKLTTAYPTIARAPFIVGVPSGKAIGAGFLGPRSYFQANVPDTMGRFGAEIKSGRGYLGSAAHETQHLVDMLEGTMRRGTNPPVDPDSPLARRLLGADEFQPLRDLAEDKYHMIDDPGLMNYLRSVSEVTARNAATREFDKTKGAFAPVMTEDVPRNLQDISSAVPWSREVWQAMRDRSHDFPLDLVTARMPLRGGSEGALTRFDNPNLTEDLRNIQGQSFPPSGLRVNPLGTEWYPDPAYADLLKSAKSASQRYSRNLEATSRPKGYISFDDISSPIFTKNPSWRDAVISTFGANEYWYPEAVTKALYDRWKTGEKLPRIQVKNVTDMQGRHTGDKMVYLINDKGSRVAEAQLNANQAYGTGLIQVKEKLLDDYLKFYRNGRWNAPDEGQAPFREDM